MEYKTIQKSGSAEFVEKRSRFIGYSCPVRTEEEATAFIKSIQSKHWDASHNVYAYSLREGQIKRYSDDGEPQGTAGIPVLDVLLKSGVTDAVLVVTRYFGGILLGGGGLVRAYSHGASIGLEAGGIIAMQLCVLGEIVCSYSQYGRVASLIPETGGITDDSAFGEQVVLRFHIRKESLQKLEDSLTDATRGSCSVAVLGESFFEAAL